MTDPKGRDTTRDPVPVDDAWSTPPEVPIQPATQPKPAQSPPVKPPSRRDPADAAPSHGAPTAQGAAPPRSAPKPVTAPAARATSRSPGDPASKRDALAKPPAVLERPPATERSAVVGGGTRGSVEKGSRLPEPPLRQASPKSVAPEVPRARDQSAQPAEPKSPDWLDALLADVATTDLRRASGGEPDGELALRAAMALASYDEPSVAGAEWEASTSGKRCDVGLCTFWIGPRCFALDIRLVGEVVHVDRVVELPLTPPAFVGMFNLRGTPLPLVDLAKVLQLRGGAEVDTSEGRTLLALVLRFSGITVGALIDRMQAVVPPGKEQLVRAEEGDNPLVQGFLAGRRGAKDTVTVLDADVLEARFNDLKFASRSVA